jgi:hypothetical protein
MLVELQRSKFYTASNRGAARHSNGQYDGMSNNEKRKNTGSAGAVTVLNVR